MRTTNKLKIVIIVLLVYIATIITVKAQPPGNPPHGWGNHPWGEPPGLNECFHGPCIPVDNDIEWFILFAVGFGGLIIYKKVNK